MQNDARGTHGRYLGFSHGAQIGKTITWTHRCIFFLQEKHADTTHEAAIYAAHIDPPVNHPMECLGHEMCQPYFGYFRIDIRE